MEEKIAHGSSSKATVQDKQIGRDGDVRVVSSRRKWDFSNGISSVCKIRICRFFPFYILIKSTIDKTMGWCKLLER